jgi:hypothetical protein
MHIIEGYMWKSVLKDNSFVCENIIYLGAVTLCCLPEKRCGREKRGLEGFIDGIW